MCDELADDESHPIPKVDVIDAVITLEGGGAYYALVIARPLKADNLSKLRLRRKIERYVGDFYSAESTKIQGTPKPGKMRIYANIHKDSDSEVFAEVQSYEPWLLENGIRLVVSHIDDNGHKDETK